MNTPVNFDIAKLLKEKGFDEQVLSIYIDGKIEELRSTISNSQFTTSRTYSAPTIAEVVMWLYEKHKLWILSLPTLCGYFAWKIIDMQDNPEKPIERPPYKDVDGVDYRTPTEAYEAAIEYTLQNLIRNL